MMTAVGWRAASDPFAGINDDDIDVQLSAGVLLVAL
jgi:hypothetical protein